MSRRKAFRILQIEDNPLDQQVVADMLSAQKAVPYTLDTAATLSRGRELLEAGEYDLVLLDLNLPDSQGIATLEEIVSADSTLAIVVASGMDDEATATESLEKGAQDYLLKGHFDGGVLARSIRYAAYHKHLEESLRRAQETLKREVEERTKELAGANRELKSTAEQYRNLFNDSVEALFTLDQRGHFTEVNDVFVELTGYPRKETIGESFRKGVNEEDARRFYASYSQMYRSGEPVRDFEFTLVRKDGTKRTVEGSANLLYRDGVFTGFQGVLRDVTERKRAQEALRESEERFRNLFENSIEAIFTIDLKGRVTSMNKAAELLSGYPGNESIGKSTFDRLKPEVRKRIVEEYKGLYESGRPIEYIMYQMLNRQGQEISVEGSVSLIRKENRVVGFQGTLRDITDRRRAEEALRESEEKYRQVVENAQEAIMIFVDGLVVYANPMTERMTGYSPEELKGKSLGELTFPEDNEPAEREFRRKLGGDSLTYPSEYRYIKKTGETGWYEAIGVAITWEGKEGLMVFAREVTERKKLEGQFLQAQKMEAIGAMAGGIAHNFNNVLVGIMGYSEYLLGKRGEGDPEYKALKTIFEGTLKASQLTRELLNVTRAGEYRLVTGSVNEIVEHILPLVTGAFDKSIEIKTILSDSLPSFEVDASYVEQCVLNLCINARDAMLTGGTLVIETSHKYLDGDFVRTHIGSQEGEHLVLSVTDTGTGMTQEVKDHLFEPFFTTKLDQGGTGMGLATVYGTVKKHGGFITVYSEPGEGTTFNLYFPVTRGTVKKDRVLNKKDHEGGQETILIIDDEPVVRNVWAEYLLRMGYSVLLAENGQQGLSMFREKSGEIDLVILDVIMPKMGGKDTLAGLREADPGVKVLITSGYTLNGKAGEIDMSGVEGFIQKPATLREFSEKIRKVLDGTDR